jgi:hypothetical protein
LHQAWVYRAGESQHVYILVDADLLFASNDQMAIGHDVDNGGGNRAGKCIGGLRTTFAGKVIVGFGTDTQLALSFKAVKGQGGVSGIYR